MKNIIKSLIEEMEKTFQRENDTVEYKKKLTQVLKGFVHLRPNITPDVKFKKHLKEKIDTLLSFNTKEKKSSFVFLIPSISFLFVFGMFYMYFVGIDFFESDEKKMDSFKERLIIEQQLDEVEELFLQEVENIDVSDQNVNEQVSQPMKESKEKEAPTLLKKAGKENIEDERETHALPEEVQEEGERTDIQDTQIIDILGEGEEIQDSSFPEAKGLGRATPMFFDDSIVSGSMKMQTFTEFCKTGSGVLVEEQGKVFCEIGSIQCSESDYQNQNCHFSQKK